MLLYNLEYIINLQKKNSQIILRKIFAKSCGALCDGAMAIINSCTFFTSYNKKYENLFKQKYTFL